MNLLDKIKFVLLFVLALNILISAQDSCQAAITIECDIPNVILSFNGIEFEQNNQFMLQLKKGIYKITLMENSDRLDAKTIFDTIYVDDCDEKYFKYFFNEEVFLDSKPQDAKIISGDSLLGYTPLFVNKNLSPFLISKDGFESLSILSNQLTENNIFNLKFIGRTKKKVFLKRYSLKLFLAQLPFLAV
ncbi:MAG: hypothetical protein IPJ03_03830 [Ignavibacteriales bacterium]|nr:hypothetical protein [Ignavibacteriales bacterium]